jgi:septum site-determining protein MinC
VLEPTRPVEAWLAGLTDLARQSPGFFDGRPVILDSSQAASNAGELRGLIASLENLGVRVMGVDGAQAAWLGPGLPPLVAGGRQAGKVEVKGRTPEPRKATPSLLVEQPVRSGQSIIYPQGDVIVMGSVASGAEIVAAGSIHVYGTLRGRALAGTVGHAGARIFCRRFEAELLAIDGIYRSADELDVSLAGKAVQAWLDGETLRTAVLD